MTLPGGAVRLAVAACVSATALASGVVGAARGATITPNTTSDILADDGQCSLREAITAAYTHLASGAKPGECAAGTGEDVIRLAPGHYFLSIPGAHDDANLSGDLDIRSDLTIQGSGAASTIIDGAGKDRVIEIMPNVVARIEGVTISGGLSPPGSAGKEAKTGAPAIGEGGGEGEGGGGILDLGTLTLADSVVSDNSTGAGGSGGDAHGEGGPAEGIGGAGGAGGAGGGIEATGPLTIEDSSISANSTGDGGAGGSGFGGAGVPGMGGKASGEGGEGIGGEGGEGGEGAGVEARSALTVLDSAVSSNAGGQGGSGGEGIGGLGASESGSPGASNGGAALGGRGGAGGSAAGLDGRDGAVISASAFAGNTSGAGGEGNIGEGGGGGIGSVGANGGLGHGGEGGEGGFAGGLLAAGPPGTVTVDDSTVTGNATGTGATAGGGIGGERGAGLMLSGSAGVADGGDGGLGGNAGGLAVEGTGAPIVQDTIDANSTGAGGAGGTASSPGGAGLEVPGASEPAGSVGGAFVTLSATLVDSIVSSNSPQNCGLAPGAALADGGHDIAFDGGGCPGADADPQLGPLQGNGGPTDTQAIAASSPAVDGVPATGSGCLATDQRGVLRPAGAACDIGAFEIATAGATTGQASSPSASSASLNGTARNPDIAAGAAFFQYGATTSYGSQTAPQAVGATAAAQPLSSDVTGLAAGTAYHYRLVVTNALGTVFGADEIARTTGSTLGPAPAAAPVAAPPVLGGLTIQPSRLAPERGRGASILARLRRGRGAVVSYEDSEAASTTFVVEQAHAGFRNGHSCTARPPRHRGGRVVRCTRYTARGSFAHSDRAGANSFDFSGRLGGRPLAAGSYRLAASPQTGAGSGRGASAGFHVI